jgi:pimeloyl-ACP methyl ester carboxylesterase
MMKLRTLAALAGRILTATLDGFETHAQPATPIEAGNVVLIHGAWADGSSWAEVIPRLQAAGLQVTAVQNPLTTLADSVAATRRALALQDGPTVLVAHSWGGTVLSEVGIDPKVTALVYVAARAPDAGEDFVALSRKFPTGPVRAGIQQHDGFTTISEEAFHDRGISPQTSRCLVALRQGWRHSGGGEDEDGIRRVSISLQFQSTAGGRRKKPRTHEGAVVKNGPAARNSFSRMLGSWFGIAKSHRIRGWQGAHIRPSIFR